MITWHSAIVVVIQVDARGEAMKECAPNLNEKINGSNEYIEKAYI